MSKRSKRIKLSRGHRKVDLADDQDIVVDQLALCNIHKDKQIELYCEQCQQLICMTCKATKHNVHQSQTIDEALEKIIPEVEEDAKRIDEDIQEIDISSETLQQKISETKESFQKCCNELEAIAEARKIEIEDIKRKMKADLKGRETEEISKLEAVQAQLELKKKENENIRRMLRASRDASLLRELVYGGLRDKVQVLKKYVKPSVQLEINQPQFSSNFSDWKKLTENSLLGNVVYSVMPVDLTVGSVLPTALSNVLDVDFNQYFNKFKKVMEICEDGHCFKIKLINGAIWAPLYDKQKIKIFNTNGNLEKTIELLNPLAVEQGDNGDIFIACHSQAGLYVMTNDETPQLIKTGSFADLYSHASKVFVLKYDENKTIMEYLPLGSTNSSCSDIRSRWQSGREWTISQVDSSDSIFDKLVVTGGDELQFFVSHWSNNNISQYNMQGQCIKQFGSSQETGDGNLHWPWLCGIDRQSHLLVADELNKTYKILDPGTGLWRAIGLRGVKYVYDAKIDSEKTLWLCHKHAKKCIISKHEPQ